MGTDYCGVACALSSSRPELSYILESHEGIQYVMTLCFLLRFQILTLVVLCRIRICGDDGHASAHRASFASLLVHQR